MKIRNAFLFLATFFPVLPLSAQQLKPNLPWVDISDWKDHQTVIAQGTVDLYNGHPTTVLLDDGHTILAPWSRNHGGPAEFIGKSTDGGQTWTVSTAPAQWKGMRNCPSIYKLTDPAGKQRLFVFCTMYAEIQGAPNDMCFSYSEDNGQTWSAAKRIPGHPCIMAFCSIVRLHNGDYLGLYHKSVLQGNQDSHQIIVQSISKDGGLTWDEPRVIGNVNGIGLCEPCGFYSPKEDEICCLMRENYRTGPSYMMFSRDQGKTWTAPEPAPWGLTGDRHMAKYLPDGRLFIDFRDQGVGSPTKSHFTGWVGTYDDIKNGWSGEYKVKLLHSFAGWDCGYPGLEVLPDGTIVTMTYIKNHPGKSGKFGRDPGVEGHSIVQSRFKIEELDALLK